MPKEAQARIKINKLLEAAGWRFFDSAEGKANIALEPNVKLSHGQVDAMDELGNDFETTSKGYIDFLLLDEKAFPLVVLEAKAEDKNPLIGKEQARKYAKLLNCRLMTTGYDCPDLLNLALMRPVFSPSDFVQIKGRGTRKHDFTHELQDENLKAQVTAPNKTAYKLFDFFATCEYFEEKFNYDEVLKLPRPGSVKTVPPGEGGGDGGEQGEGGSETAPGAYLYQVLNTLNLQSFKGGAGIPGLNRNDVYEACKVPLPPREVQNQIVAEIEGYQKTIEEHRKAIRELEDRSKEVINKVWGE